MKQKYMVIKSFLLTFLVIFFIISCKKKTEFAEGELKWRYKTTGKGISYSAIGSDGTIFFGSFLDAIYAVNPNGKLKWRYNIIMPVTNPVISADGTIYFGSDFYLYAINQNGTLKWYSDPMAEVSSPAIGIDSTIYVSTWDFLLEALNQVYGSSIWVYKVPGNLFISPIIDSNGIIYAGSKDSCVYAITPGCSLKWHYKTDGYISSNLAIGNDNTIYFGTKDSFLYALSQDGTLKWRYKIDNSLEYDSPVINLEGTIYIGTNKLYALNPDGTLKWRYAPESKIGTTPAIDSDGIIYFGSDDGYLNALNPNGSLFWRFKANGAITSLTIGKDSTIYFGCTDKYFYAVQGSGTLADSPWPKFRHDLKNTGRVEGGE